MKSRLVELRSKIKQYGLLAMTDQELVDVLKYKGTSEQYFESAEFIVSKELVRRRKDYQTPITKILKSYDIYEKFSFLQTEEVESFWAIYLNRANMIINTEFVCKGHSYGTLVDMVGIVKTAINLRASSVVVCHNHPSGNLKPSDADVKITKSIKEGLRLFDMTLIDHIIIGGNGSNGYFSFADEGIL